MNFKKVFVLFLYLEPGPSKNSLAPQPCHQPHTHTSKRSIHNFHRTTKESPTQSIIARKFPNPIFLPDHFSFNVKDLSNKRAIILMHSWLARWHSRLKSTKFKNPCGISCMTLRLTGTLSLSNRLHNSTQSSNSGSKCDPCQMRTVKNNANWKAIPNYDRHRRQLRQQIIVRQQRRHERVFRYFRIAHLSQRRRLVIGNLEDIHEIARVTI